MAKALCNLKDRELQLVEHLLHGPLLEAVRCAFARSRPAGRGGGRGGRRERVFMGLHCFTCHTVSKARARFRSEEPEVSTPATRLAPVLLAAAAAVAATATAAAVCSTHPFLSYLLVSVRIGASIPGTNQGRRRQEGLVAKMLRKEVGEAALAALRGSLLPSSSSSGGSAAAGGGGGGSSRGGARSSPSAAVDVDSQVAEWVEGLAAGDKVSDEARQSDSVSSAWVGSRAPLLGG